MQKRYKASLALYRFCKQKYQKGFIHRKLTVPTSEREGKLSNPRGRAARAMHGENLRKFTETRAHSPRARHAVISSQPRIQYRNRKLRRFRDPSNEYRNKVPISTGIYHSGRSFLECTRRDILLKLLNLAGLLQNTRYPRVRFSPGLNTPISLSATVVGTVAPILIMPLIHGKYP